MTLPARDLTTSYTIDIQPLDGTVTAWRGDAMLAQSDRAQVMFETRLQPTVYFPVEDICAEITGVSDLQTFCPFKGTATYRGLRIDGTDLDAAIWCYDSPLPESRRLAGYAAFMPGIASTLDTGDTLLPPPQDGHLSGALVDWLLREAPAIPTPEDLTRALAHNMIAHGIAISRISIMIWSLHPMIAGRNFVWEKDGDSVNSYAPSYEIHDHPGFVNSPLRHVAAGLGGVRARLADGSADSDSFPILQDLRAKGATDYVAMPMPFSDGRKNVLTLTCDHPDGFTTANLGLVFECSPLISRLFEVFTLKDNARSLLETYLGRRTGARVLGGEIRRGDGDEIDAAIMFCDLRGSTRLAETMARDDYLSLLNAFFETASTHVEEMGGEVLKFIGDAVLAVFPADTTPDEACDRALQAAQRIVRACHAETRPMHCAAGLDFGRVTYGNVGSQGRLDFTVIGQAANVAARLGDYGKQNNHAIVTSDAFCRAGCTLLPLGPVPLHNVAEPVMAFAAATG
ncbi:MAG: DUF427 domain-containing protein [Marinibacterium sp.]|nr:DUF427 domain-containing protein [Marinibacterium sp.]